MTCEFFFLFSTVVGCREGAKRYARATSRVAWAVDFQGFCGPKTGCRISCNAARW
jgi:hypothetical protein